MSERLPIDLPCTGAPRAILPFRRPPAPAVGSARGHVPALDGVRGLAIGLVLLTHGMDAGLRPANAIEGVVYNVARWGWVGVDLFFVLSGFLITGILLAARERPHYLRNFFARRALRIFPLYGATLLVCLVLLPLVPLPAFDWLRDLSSQQLWFWAHLSNYYKIAVQGPPVGWLSTLWSLAVEEHFYLVWPFVVWKLSDRHLGWGCLLGAAGALALRIALAGRGFSGDYIYRSTLTRIDPLLLGALLAVLAQGGLQRWAPWARAAVPLLLAAMVVQAVLQGGASGRDRTLYGQTAQYTVVGLLFASLLVLVLTSPGSRVQTFLTIAPLRALGKYSYAMYVFNKPMFQLARWCMSGELGLSGLPLLALAGYLVLGVALTFGAALLSWHLLEKHFLELKRFFEARPEQPARPAWSYRTAA